MRIKKSIWGFFCAFFLLYVVFGAIIPAAAAGKTDATSGQADETAAGQPDFSLYATAAVLMDADSGRVLYGKNQEQILAMASTTKIMTGIVVLETTSLDEIVSVSPYASSMPKVKLYINAGEQFSVRDLLFSLMLESHNDSAMALAEHVGKKYLSEELATKDTALFTAEESRQAMAAFAALMNQKAEELGCENTWFITPNGLDATETLTLGDGSVIQKEHSTTAEDLAKIMSYCIEKSPCKEAFLEITRTPTYSFYANGKNYFCTNHNAFLSMMSGALSGKTGFTNKAGYCYVGALERDGRTFVVALLACGWPNNKTYKWSDTRELMQYGIDNYFYRSFSEEGIAFDEKLLYKIPVSDGQTDFLGATAYTDIRISDAAEGAEGLLLRPDEEIKVEYGYKKLLKAPVESGTEVGYIEYIVGDVVYKREMIVTVNSVKKIDLRWCFEQILHRFLMVQ